MTNLAFRRAGERGTASVEGVIVLPVFVILFVGIFLVRDLNRSRLDADTEARRCAWQYSANACETIPKGCEDVLKGVHRGNTTPDFDDAIKGLEDELKSTNDAERAVKNIVTGMITGALAKMLTRSLDAKKTFELERPGLFGGGKTLVSGKYRLACNIPAQDNDNIAKAAWKQFRP